MIRGSELSGADGQDAPEIRAQIDFEGQPENRIVVPDAGAHYTEIVRVTNKSLSPRKLDYRRGLVSAAPGGLNVRVSPASRTRALRLLDTFVRECEKRGFEVTARSTSHDAYSEVRLHDESLEVSLEERCRQHDHVPSARERRDLAEGRTWAVEKHDIVPTGVLVLKVGGYPASKTWRDRPTRPLELCLNDVMVALVRIAILCVRPTRLEHEAQEREWARERTRQERERRRREIFSKALESWRVRSELNAFLQECEAELSTRKIDLEGKSSQARWLRWARRYAAMAARFPELLQEIDAESTIDEEI